MVLREVIDQFGQDHPVKKDFENRYHLTIEDVLISDGLIGWLMMLQDHVKVIKPYSLQEKMKKRIEKMFIQYKESYHLDSSFVFFQSISLICLMIDLKEFLLSFG